MQEIVWDQCLEKDGISLCSQIVKYGTNSFTFSEGRPLPPGVSGVEPRQFGSKDEAMKFVEENYIPGRRTFGWNLKLPSYPETN
jgi:hypothetical protein